MRLFTRIFDQILILTLATFMPFAAAACAERHKRTCSPGSAADADADIDRGDSKAVVAAAPGEFEDDGDLVIARNILDACGIPRAVAYFTRDSAELGDAARDLLEQVGDCFADGPMRGECLEVIGHADPRGSNAHNRELGLARAESVAAFLEREGVEAGCLEVISMGELLASDDPAHWYYDRRVVLMLDDDYSMPTENR